MNRRRLTANDMLPPEQEKNLLAALKKVKYHDDFGAERDVMYRHERTCCMSIWGFLAICSTILATLMFGSPGTSATGVFLLFIYPAGILAVISIWGYMINFFPEIIRITSFVLLLLAVVCAVMGSVFQVRIMGTAYGWIGVFVAVGCVIVVLFRIPILSDIEDAKIYNEKIRRYNRDAEQALCEAEALYCEPDLEWRRQLQDYAAAHHIAPVPLTERAAWFGWKRQYKKGSRIFLPTVGASGTDFSGAFRDGYIPSDSEFTTIKRTVKQQQYGWRSLTAAEAQALIRQRNLAPFFQYETPWFEKDWVYHVMEHSFDYTDEITHDGRGVQKVQRDSWSQQRFDAKTKEFEDDLFGPSIFRRDLDVEKMYHPLISDEIEHYKKEKERIREELGCDYELVAYGKLETTFKNCREDHIGALLIRDRSNQLVAVYCEDTGASLNFCCRLVRKYEPFELTPLLYPRNNSQMAWIYEKF